MGLGLPTVHNGDWRGVRHNFQRIDSVLLGPDATPSFASITISGLTEDSLIYAGSGGTLTSLGVATNGQLVIGSTGTTPVLATLTGTANEIDITNAGGSITIGLVNPLIVGKGGTGAATLTDHGILLGSGTSAVTALGEASNGQIPIGSVGADPVLAALTGTANQVTVTNGAGSITLSTPQDIHTGASPTFAGLTVTNACALGSDSAVFQPNTDSVTFFQVLDADGGTPVFNIDTVNERVGLYTAAPAERFEINDSDNYRVRFNVTGTDKRVLFEVRNPTDSISIQAGAYGSTFAGSFGGIDLASSSWMTGFGDIVVYGNKESNGQFAIITNATEVFRIDAAGNVGVMTNSPQTRVYALEVNDSPATMRGVQSVLIGNSGHSSHVTGRKARGTEASPVVLGVDDGVGAFTAEGYNGSAFERAGYLRWVVTDVSGGNLSTKFTLATSTLGSETDKLTIASNGDATFAGNLIIPNAGYIGSVSDTDALQIEADGDVVLTSSFSLVTTTTSALGVLRKGTNRFLHDFHHPTGNGAIPVGQNVFVGEDAGNFSMGSTATQTYHGSYNAAMGYRAFYANTTGYRNSAIGYKTLYLNTTGYLNVGVGQTVLYYNTSGYRNMGVGGAALFRNTEGHDNLGIGYASDYYNETGDYNTSIGAWSGGFGGGGVNSHSNQTSIGAYAGYNNTTGGDCIYIGYKAAYRQTTNSDLLIIDNQDRGSAANEITNCLLYGVFNATPANQSLRINGEILGADGAKVGDGGTTNYTQFAADGTQTMVGTARVTKYAWIPAGAVRAQAGPGTGATETTNGNNYLILSFADNVDRWAQANIKIPDDMDLSADSYLCLGWSSPATAKNAIVDIHYLITAPGDVTDAAGTADTGNTITSHADADKLVVSPVVTISGGTIQSDEVCIHLQIMRDGNNLSDTLADVLELHGIAFQYTANKLGG